MQISLSHLLFFLVREWKRCKGSTQETAKGGLQGTKRGMCVRRAGPVLFLKHTFLIYGILEACIFARVLLGGILEMYEINFLGSLVVYHMLYMPHFLL